MKKIKLHRVVLKMKWDNICEILGRDLARRDFWLILVIISIITMTVILNIIFIIFSVNNEDNSNSLNRENFARHLRGKKAKRGSLNSVHAPSQLNVVFETVTQDRRRLTALFGSTHGTLSGPMLPVCYPSRLQSFAGNSGNWSATDAVGCQFSGSLTHAEVWFGPRIRMRELLFDFLT